MDTSLIITAITRFGSILFIAYLISVLLHVYAYLMRLAAYTYARADALALLAAKADAKHFRQLADVLNAENIEFGKSPVYPTKQILDVAKMLTKKDDKEAS